MNPPVFIALKGILIAFGEIATVYVFLHLDAFTTVLKLHFQQLFRFAYKPREIRVQDPILVSN